MRYKNYYKILIQKKPKRHVEAYRRPEGMHRELYALLYSDSRYY